MKSKRTVFLKRAGSVRWLEPTASGCLGKWVFILHTITRASVFAYRAGECCWMKAHHVLNGSPSEWVGGSACLPFSHFFFPFFSDVVISENISNWRARERWHLMPSMPPSPNAPEKYSLPACVPHHIYISQALKSLQRILTNVTWVEDHPWHRAG